MDRTSIGQGAYDPLTAANVPYRLSGEPVSRHLSALFDSPYRVGGRSCDLAPGCSPAP